MEKRYRNKIIIIIIIYKTTGRTNHLLVFGYLPSDFFQFGIMMMETTKLNIFF